MQRTLIINTCHIVRKFLAEQRIRSLWYRHSFENQWNCCEVRNVDDDDTSTTAMAKRFELYQHKCSNHRIWFRKYLFQFLLLALSKYQYSPSAPRTPSPHMSSTISYKDSEYRDILYLYHDIVTFTSFSTELYLNIHKWHYPHSVCLCVVYNSEKTFCLCTGDAVVLLECKFYILVMYWSQ